MQHNQDLKYQLQSYRSNHASNALHLAGILPKDKDKLIKEVDLALEIGQSALVPNQLRGF